MESVSAHRPSTADVLIARRYRVERLLGRGSMGAVYVAFDTVAERRVALKRLLVTDQRSGATRFELEYRTLAGLHHPGIVEVYDYGSDEAGPFYTMELVEGSELKPLPFREACRCLRDAAAILGVLHARSLLHRDLSPRNLLRTESGQLKLIDFGALAPFGVCNDLVGTPPLVPPEALRGEPLDQRSDLFALGALGYWLITGVHAFPARQLSELPRLHEQTPPPPSSLLALAPHAESEPLPAELDALLLALLRIERDARPASTSELIDRLHALVGLAPEASEHSIEGYLNSKVFVGREDERARVRDELLLSQRGQIRTVDIQAPEGFGASRLLSELALGARLAGATVVQVSASESGRAYAAANAIALGLLAALPGEALEQARPFASDLALVSLQLRERLGLPAEAVTGALPREVGVRIQLALASWIIELSSARSIALLVDDAHAIDEESCALLAALARTSAKSMLLLVVTSAVTVKSAASALASLRGVATVMLLPPLTAPETYLIARSQFGAAPYLERTAERLFRVSQGHPAHLLELTDHLVRSGLARYVDGAWSLPAQLDETALPHSHEEAQLERLALLSPAARALAELLSIAQHGALSSELLAAAAGLDAQQTTTLLQELERHGVTRRLEEGYELVHRAVRTALAAQLPEARRVAGHLALGKAQQTRAGDDRVLLLRASLNLFRGGDVDSALKLMRRAGAQQSYVTLRQTARLFEEAYLLLSAHGCDAHACATPLATLALASYHVDRHYARYADDAVRVFEQILHLRLARRLGRVLGGKLALIIALLTALGGVVSRRAYAPSLKELISLCMRSCVALTGMAGCCLDARNGRRYANVLSPFMALGPYHGASVACELALLFSRGISDSPGRNVATLGTMIKRIEKNEPIREVTPEIRMEALSGTLFVYGANVCSRDDDEALRVADRLDGFSPLYALSADQIRCNYYASQGDMERAEQCRMRIELHAVRLGSSWQMETWTPAHAIKTAIRTHDALLARRAAEALARLTTEVPSLAREERYARGVYMMLRGKYREAIKLLSVPVEPLSVAGWSLARAALARCHNALGEHARAQEICQDALSRLSTDDLRYVVLNLGVELELAHADAGLGKLDEAARRLDDALARHAPQQSALTLGALHHARCEIALRAGDLTLARQHFAEVEARYGSLRIATLHDVLEALRRKLRVTGPISSDDERSADDRLHLQTQMQRLLSREGDASTVEQRAQLALQLAVEHYRAASGLLVLQAGNASTSGEALPLGVTSWSRARLLSYGEDEQTAQAQELTSSNDNELVVADVRYVFMPVWTSSTEELPVAGLVLGFKGALGSVPDAVVLRALARYLVHDETRSMSR